MLPAAKIPRLRDADPAAGHGLLARVGDRDLSIVLVMSAVIGTVARHRILRGNKDFAASNGTRKIH